MGQFHHHFTCAFLPISFRQKITKQKCNRALLYKKHACKMLMKLNLCLIINWIILSLIIKSAPLNPFLFCKIHSYKKISLLTKIFSFFCWQAFVFVTNRKKSLIVKWPKIRKWRKKSFIGSVPVSEKLHKF